nr:diguanylate cyclase [Methylobacterium sp. UNC378MF]
MLCLAEAAHAERLRTWIQALQIRGARGPIGLSCSFGASTCQPGDSVADLVKWADVALSATKAGGRNRVVIDQGDRVRAVAG